MILYIDHDTIYRPPEPRRGLRRRHAPPRFKKKTRRSALGAQHAVWDDAVELPHVAELAEVGMRQAARLEGDEADARAGGSTMRTAAHY